MAEAAANLLIPGNVLSGPHYGRPKWTWSGVQLTGKARAENHAGLR